MTVVALHSVTDAVRFMLEAALAPAGIPVGDGEAPGRPGVKPVRRYVVLWQIGGGVSGDQAHPTSQATVTYQTTSVADSRWAAEQAAGMVRASILGRNAGTGEYTNPIDEFDVNGGTFTLTGDRGLTVWHREHDSSGGVLIEGDTWNAVDRYTLHIAPATA